MVENGLPPRQQAVRQLDQAAIRGRIGGDRPQRGRVVHGPEGGAQGGGIAAAGGIEDGHG
jgi:hypothetical protein